MSNLETTKSKKKYLLPVRAYITILLYLWVSFLYNFYHFEVQRFLVAFFWGILFYIFQDYLFLIRWHFRLVAIDDWLSLGIYIGNIFFCLATVFLIAQFPTLFNPALFFMKIDAFLLFLGGTIAALFIARKFLKFFSTKELSLPGFLLRFSSFFKENISGVSLAVIFFPIYFFLASVFNRTEFTLVDSLFEADNSYWLYFLGMNYVGGHVPVRAVHPLAYLILRPLTWLISLFLNGNTYYSILILIAFTGAVSVFFTWFFLKKYTLQNSQAIFFASFLGVTTSHLIFSSFAESYVFSAAALIIFFVVLQHKDNSLITLIPAGLVVFGITVSNIAQTIIGILFTRKSIKFIIRYILYLLIFAVLLSTINNLINPFESGYFFIPSTLIKEKQYTQAIFDFPAWKLHGRIYATVRNVFLYPIIAPNSFFIIPDPGKPLPRISFFSFSPGQFSYSPYSGVGDITVFLWILLFSFSMLFFALHFFKRKSWKSEEFNFSLVFLCNIAFNLFLHIIYGEDPFLYSANWAYALILFTALSLYNIAQSLYGKIFFVTFLGMVMINNLFFLFDFMSFLEQIVH